MTLLVILKEMINHLIQIKQFWAIIQCNIRMFLPEQNDKIDEWQDNISKALSKLVLIAHFKYEKSGHIMLVIVFSW